MERTRSSDKPEALKTEVSYRLVVPIEIEGTLTETVTVKRLKVKHRLEIQKAKLDDAEKEARLITAATGLAPSDVSELDMADYLGIQEIIEGFFSARAKT